MILFNLTCAAEHQFEAWFRDGATYDSQALAGEISCPCCGDTHIRKAPMAPRVITGRAKERAESRQEARQGAAEVAPPALNLSELRQALVSLRKQVEKNCDYVGQRFPEEARRMHYGESEKRAVYGEASLAEARSLLEEGVEVLPLPPLPRQDG